MEAKQINVKNSSIEFYRFLFTIIICLHHSTMFIGEKSWLKHGYICVEFFFMLSGFFLYKSFIREKSHSSTEYIVKRLKRLWPEFAVAAVLEIIARRIFLNDFNPTKALNELLMVGNTGLFRLGGYNYPAWYVPVMFLCGIIIYGMLSVFEKTYKKVIAPIIILIGYTYINGLDTGIENWQYTKWFSIPMVRGICAMSIGVIIASLVSNNYAQRISKRLATVIEIISIAFIVLGFTTNIFDDMVAIFAFIPLIFVTVTQRGYISTLLSKTLIWNKCGEYSYSIYLNHAIIIFVLHYFNGHIYPIPSMLKLPLVIAFVGIYSVIAKVVIWKLIGIIETKVRAKS